MTSGEPEWNRDDPDYVAIRTAFAEARAALTEERYADFFRLIHPNSRLKLLDAVAFGILLESAPSGVASTRGKVLLRHRIPTSVRIDPASRTSPEEQLRAAYAQVDDPAEAFADLARLSTGARIGSAFNVEKAGEPRLLESPAGRAKVYVCRPGSPVEAKTPWVIYRRLDGKWWLALD